jgi:Phosphopantothenoylcysteine synthetase/decarboxylase
LKEKNADVIVLNTLNDKGATFGVDTNKVTLFFRNGNKKATSLKTKVDIAKEIVDALKQLQNETVH